MHISFVFRAAPGERREKKERFFQRRSFQTNVLIEFCAVKRARLENIGEILALFSGNL